jgi:hypothetical protein
MILAYASEAEIVILVGIAIFLIPALVFAVYDRRNKSGCLLCGDALGCPRSYTTEHCTHYPLADCCWCGAQEEAP